MFVVLEAGLTAVGVVLADSLIKDGAAFCMRGARKRINGRVAKLAELVVSKKAELVGSLLPSRAMAL